MLPSDKEQPAITVSEYLARAPTDQQWATREASRHRDRSTDERFDALEGLLRQMQELLGARTPGHDGSLPFWRHWSDPTFGRPR